MFTIRVLKNIYLSLKPMTILQFDTLLLAIRTPNDTQIQSYTSSSQDKVAIAIKYRTGRAYESTENLS